MTWYWLVIALILAPWLVNQVLSEVFGLIPPRCRHGVRGRCEECAEEVQARAQARAEERAEAKQRRLEIEEEYKDLDDETRNRLITLVKERAKRLDLRIGPGDLEAAVVKVHRKSQRGDF
jgi:hypothetical protein